MSADDEPSFAADDAAGDAAKHELHASSSDRAVERGLVDDSDTPKHDSGSKTNNPAPPETPQQRLNKRRLLIFIGIGLLVLVVAVVIYYIVAIQGRESTDDAYTDGRAISIAAKVSGYVTVLAVQDNQLVKAGDLIVAIDQRDYDVALQNAQASLAANEAQLDSARLDLEIRQTSTGSDLESAQASVIQARANLMKARADLERQKSVNPQATTQQQTDTVAAQAATQEAQMRQAEAQLRTARLVPQNIALAMAKVRELEAQVDVAQSQVDQAKLNLGYTEIRAPQDGRITRRNVEIGSYLQPGQVLLSVVSPEVWVTANYKENQLENMRSGQPVEMSIDAYPQLQLHGHVDSIQMGSGSRFSAFPAENATGNFVKIVQRIPVKILIDSGLDPNVSLPLGASVVPIVDER